MHAERRDRLAAGFDDWGVDALLITNLINCRYLCGFTGSNGSLLIERDRATLITDSRYETAASEQCPDVNLALARDTALGGVEEAKRLGIGSVGVESGAVALTEWRRLDALAAELHLTLVALDDPVGPLRWVKDDAEIKSIATACQISQRALDRLLPEVRVGVTENWVAARLEFLMREEGAEAAAFPTIAATGSSSAEPHHEPTNRTIAQGDLLKIDFGARWAGYHADMTRTFVVGTSPQNWQLEIHGVVAQAAAAGRAALRAGVASTAVDAAARDVINEAGYGDKFGHGLGHGVGLQIHEPPFLGVRGLSTLAERMTVTVEPGVYLPGQGGVRIEDSLLITADESESFTTTTRELLSLG